MPKHNGNPPARNGSRGAYASLKGGRRETTAGFPRNVAANAKKKGRTSLCRDVRPLKYRGFATPV